MRGKQLEKEVKNTLKEFGLFHHKFTDSFASRGMVVPVPSDFLVVPKNAPVIFLECKETNKPNIPLTAFRPSQFKAIKWLTFYKNVSYYILVKHKETYYLFIGKEIIDCLEGGEKSINLTNDYLQMENVADAIDIMLKDNDGTL